MATVEQFFAQLYADPDISNDPFSAGRQMNCHFALPLPMKMGNGETWSILKILPVIWHQQPRKCPGLLDWRLHPKLFRNVEELKQFKELSDNGNEVCFATIGDASTSEGHFWETINAAGVLQVPWLFLFGMMVMVFLFPKNTRLPKVLFLMH